jgi:hypothetical protein
MNVVDCCIKAFLNISGDGLTHFAGYDQFNQSCTMAPDD